jgi:hypothetical protein
MSNLSGIKFIDLFAGIGGIRQAFEKFGCECVFTSEWDSLRIRIKVAGVSLFRVATLSHFKVAGPSHFKVATHSHSNAAARQ